MAPHTLRFAQVSNLRIDVPLRGVGALPDAARRLVEDAPAAGWQRIVEACIDRDVAFLLLTPHTAAGELAVIDRRTLLSGFQQLSEFGIQVYWSTAPGEAISAPMRDELPNNITLLTEQDSTATLIREGRVAAVFSLGPASGFHRAATQLEAAATAEPPLRIRIAEEAGAIDAIPQPDHVEAATIGELPRLSGNHDFVACWGGAREQTRNVGSELWADPGNPLARTPDETGGGGINIVEWESGRIRDLLRAPIATVCWQRCLLGLTPETTSAELIERLQFALLEREAGIGEQLWLIEWHIVGSGPEFERLHAVPAQRELEAAVESVLGNVERLQRVHRWELRRRGMNSADTVSQRLLEWLEVHAESESASFIRDIPALLPPSDGADIAEQLASVRHSAVRDDAERLLAEWLATPAVKTG